MYQSFDRERLEKLDSLIEKYRRRPIVLAITKDQLQSLGEALYAKVDDLVTEVLLHKPIKDMLPLWEEDSRIAHDLDICDEVAAEVQQERQCKIEESERRVKEAMKALDDFLNGKIPSNDDEELLVVDGKPFVSASVPTRPADTKKGPVCRRSRVLPGSKDDNSLPPAPPSTLRRRPSFQADMSCSNIEMKYTCCQCSATSDLVINGQDLAVIMAVKPTDHPGTERSRLPVTSTPHARRNAVDPPEFGKEAGGRKLFPQEQKEGEKERPLKRSSSVHFEDDVEPHQGNRHNSTFEKEPLPGDVEVASKEKENRQPGNSTFFVPDKVTNTTIIKHHGAMSAGNLDAEVANRTVLVKARADQPPPKIGVPKRDVRPGRIKSPAPKRPNANPLINKLPARSVLPDKTGVEARGRPTIRRPLTKPQTTSSVSIRPSRLLRGAAMAGKQAEK